MSRLPVFTERADGTLRSMRPAAPPDEDALQDLIARHPEIIAGRGEPLLLITREQGVPDQLDGSHRFSLDNLFVTRSAVPVLVEVKRATDTRLRREVVGQLLDYAANGTAYWSPGLLEAEFRREAGEAAEETLREFLSDDDLADGGADFWQQVDANLEAGRVRLVVAADVIPRELARVVEFLNEQMRATVLAVELTYYEGESGLRTLVPKIIGETAKTNSTKQKPDVASVSDWISMYPAQGDEAFQTAFERLEELTKSLGGEFATSGDPNILDGFWTSDDGRRVKIFYVSKTGRVAIGFSRLRRRPAFATQEAREELYASLEQIFGQLSTTNIKGWPSFEIRQLNDQDTASIFSTKLAHIVGLAKSGK